MHAIYDDNCFGRLAALQPVLILYTGVCTYICCFFFALSFFFISFCMFLFTVTCDQRNEISYYIKQKTYIKHLHLGLFFSLPPLQFALWIWFCEHKIKFMQQTSLHKIVLSVRRQKKNQKTKHMKHNCMHCMPLRRYIPRARDVFTWHVYKLCAHTLASWCVVEAISLQQQNTSRRCLNSLQKKEPSKKAFVNVRFLHLILCSRIVSHICFGC